MTKQSLPPVSILSSDSIEEFKTADKVVLVAYFAADDKASNETFSSVADSLRDDYLFGATSDAVLAKAEGVKQPSLVLYKDFDEGKNIFTEKFDKAAIEDFAKKSSIPLVGEVGPETYAGYMAVCLVSSVLKYNVLTFRTTGWYPSRIHLRRDPRRTSRAGLDTETHRGEAQRCCQLCHHRCDGFRRSRWQLEP